MKLSFKKHPKQTGLASVGNSYQGSDIKLDGKVFGEINPPNWRTSHNFYTVSIMIKKTEPDDNPNCDWKWVFFKRRFVSDSEAREWVKSNITKITEKYTLHFYED